MELKDLGLMRYGDALEIQNSEFSKAIELKKNGGIANNSLLFCEHEHVFTLGKHGALKNLLAGSLEMQQKQAEFFEVNRGGDITYHGPGQLVGYPIFDLELFGIGLKDYIFKIEEVIIESLKHYKIEATRLDSATGVWVDVENNPRKICAIGVYSKAYVTMHGFALNANVDLSYFDMINPCGFTDKQVTSIEKELGYSIDFEELKAIVKQNFDKEFIANGSI